MMDVSVKRFINLRTLLNNNFVYQHIRVSCRKADDFQPFKEADN